MTRRFEPWLLAAAGIVAIAYLVIAVQSLDRLDPLTGDEPFYIMTAISIVGDHDLDEANNYARRDYDEFYPPDPLPANWNGWPAFPRTLPPHPATTERDGLHTKHGLGLSILIAVPYALLGRVGAVSVIWLASILVAINMYLLARDAGTVPRWSAAIAIGLAVTMPIAPYSALLFPEIPAALLLLYTVRRLAALENTPVQWTLIGSALGFLPWLHQRFVPTVIVLVAFTLVRLWRSRTLTHAVATLAPIAMGGLSLIAYNFWLYRIPIQNTADHAGFNDAGGTVNAAFGLLLDAQWGLLVAAPVYLLAIVGFPLWWKSSNVALLALAAMTPYLFVLATYRVWWGEWGPPARYLVPIAPFAAGALAATVQRLSAPGRTVLVALWGIGATQMLVGLANPQRFYHHPDGVNHLYSQLGDRLGVNVAHWLVAYQPLAQASYSQRAWMATAMLALLIAISLVLVTSDSNPAHETSFRN